MPDELDKIIRLYFDDCPHISGQLKEEAKAQLNALFLSQIKETLDKFKPDNAYFTKEQILEAFQAKYGGKK